MEEFLEQSPGFNDVANMLEEMHTLTVPASPAVVNGISTSIWRKLDARHCGPEDVAIRSDELSGLMKWKHKTATDALRKEFDSRNGFELSSLNPLQWI